MDELWSGLAVTKLGLDVVEHSDLPQDPGDGLAVFAVSAFGFEEFPPDMCPASGLGDVGFSFVTAFAVGVVGGVAIGLEHAFEGS